MKQPPETVTSADLRKNLAAHLRAVARGHTLRITVAGYGVALLTPDPDAGQPAEDNDNERAKP